MKSGKVISTVIGAALLSIVAYNKRNAHKKTAAKEIKDETTDLLLFGREAITPFYVKKQGNYKTLAKATEEFCEKFIKPVHPQNWNWSKRDFNKQENYPTVEEASVIRDIILLNMEKGKIGQIDLSKIINKSSIRSFLQPSAKYEKFNMEEFADALKMELQANYLKDANATSNHPLLIGIAVLGHMRESTSFYSRLRILNWEAQLYELEKKYTHDTENVEYKESMKTLKKRITKAKSDFKKFLEVNSEPPVNKSIAKDK